ncbi:DUF4019 domain-containing protein [Blastomonas sp. SL216]|uniref:DUF4019 domain-containing protein n=1 Tax=Blastomonas sp. SL216 TaxID=2995169 RepID=UPI002377D14D|nr:DUF4019 domain-containing protein [Blastomonas sp. SL216]
MNSQLKALALSLAVISSSGVIYANAGESQSQPMTEKDERNGPVYRVDPKVGISSDLIIHNALKTALVLEMGGAEQVYDSASVVMKGAISRSKFSGEVAAANSGFGRSVSRVWTRIEQVKVGAGAQGGVPPGGYVTVFLISHNSSGEGRVEQLSFRLDEDDRWRLAGVKTHSLRS